MISFPMASGDVQKSSMFKDDHLRVRCRHQQNTVEGGHCRKCMDMEEVRLLRNRQKARERRKGRKSRADNVKSLIEDLEKKNEEIRAKNEELARELSELDAPLLLGPLRTGQGGVEDAMLNFALLKRTEDQKESDAAAKKSKGNGLVDAAETKSKRDGLVEVTASSTTKAGGTSSGGSSTEPSRSACTTKRGGLGVSTFHFRSSTNCDSKTQHMPSISSSFSRDMPVLLMVRVPMYALR